MSRLQHQRSTLFLLIMAIAIGIFVVATVNGILWLFGGVEYHMKSYIWLFSVDIATVSAPFILLALLHIHSKQAWLMGMAMTLLLWGYYLFDGLRGDTEGNVGANIGLGLIILVSPVIISLVCLVVAKLQDGHRASPEGVG